MAYYDIDDLLASGQISIAGWQPAGNPGLVVGHQNNNLNTLLRSAGMDELTRESMVGAANAPQSASAAMQAAVAQKLVQQGLLVQNERPTRAREFPLGFESAAAIAPGAAATITSRPQIPFRAQRLVVPSDIAGSFSILDLRVGKNSQFTSAGAVPGRTFQENAVAVGLRCDTAQISQDVTLQVQNIGGAPQTFRAAVIGAAVE